MKDTQGTTVEMAGKAATPRVQQANISIPIPKMAERSASETDSEPFNARRAGQVLWCAQSAQGKEVSIGKLQTSREVDSVFAAVDGELKSPRRRV